MAKVSQYQRMTNLSGEEELLGVQGTGTKVTTLDDIANFAAVQAGAVTPTIVEQMIEPKVDASDLSADYGAAMVALKLPGSGAAKRTIAEKFASMPAVPEDFGAAADGVTDDSAAIIAMLEASDAYNFPCQLTRGKTYLIKSGVSVSGLSVNFDFNGGRVIRAADGSNSVAFEFSNPLTDITDVTSVESDSYTFPGYGTTADVSKITLADGMAVSVGDILRIVADDLIPSGGANERVGESFEVAAVESGVIYTRTPLRETYTTTVRVARMGSQRFYLANADISDEPGYPTNRSTALLRVTGYVEPEIINAKLHDGASYGLQLRACHKAYTLNLRAERLRTSESNTAYGYGIHEISSCYSRHVNPFGHLCRHVFTTGTLSTTAGSLLVHNFGAAIEPVIDNGTATDCENAAWDTHPDSYKATFRNCSQTGKVPGAGTSYYGVQLRGRGDRFLGGSTDGIASVSLIGPPNNTLPFIIKGLTHTIGEGVTRSAAIILTSAGTGSTCYAEIDATVETLNLQAISMLRTKASGTLRFRVKSSTGASANFFRASTDSVWEGDVYADMGNATGTNPRIFNAAQDSAAILVPRLYLRRGSNSGTYYIGDMDDSNGAIVIGALDCDQLPTATGGGFVEAGSSATRMVCGVTQNGVPYTGRVGTLSNSNATLNWMMADTYILSAALTGDRTVTLSSSTTTPPGRRIRFIRTSASTGAFNMSIGGVASLPSAGSSCEVVWTGTDWVGV